MLFDKPAFKNVVVNGLVLAEDGRKMSKRLKNYPDPRAVIDSYGADALRLCLLASPAVRAEDLRFSEVAVREVMRTVLIPLWNAHCFFVTYARVDGWVPPAGQAAPPAAPENVLDSWVLSRLSATVQDVRSALDNYDLQRGATRFTSFLDDLTNWYIRRSRRRFWKSDNDTDKGDAYATLHYTLVTLCQLAAPFTPFITETIYRNLRTDAMPASVHLCDYPEVQTAYLDTALNERMARTMSAVSLGRFLRTQASQKIRQPLASAVLVSAKAAVRADLEQMASVVAEELNVKAVLVQADEESLVSLSAKPNLKRLGPKLGPKMKLAMPAIAALSSADIASLRQGESLALTLADGTALTLSEDDVLIQRTEKEGMCVANEGDITVALDTRLTAELIQEGNAREVVSKLQNLRKELHFEVTDRIHICYSAPVALSRAIEAESAYICAETLALSLTAGDCADMHAVDINEVPARFHLRKA